MRRHDLDPVSLTFGLLFVGVAAGWLAVRSDAIEVEDLRWFYTGLLLIAGAAGTAISLLRDRARTVPADLAPEPDADVSVVDSPEAQS
ncbi:hypothetical protein [Sporichthya polymorpha]|uniref:hypothetical protein n=1 Tax=Sporichthya polymorpha TaxID=35751 RepID=UPI000363BEBA|nr:hypothetical protein [Sporichthya polymorpha]